MRIAIMCEGRTEKAFFPHLRIFLEDQLKVKPMPKLDPHICNGRLPTEDKLKRVRSDYRCTSLS